MKLTHGITATPEHRAWRSMRSRCTNPRLPNFGDYGGRGITVCDRWKNSFENFYADMGLKPSDKYSLDRKDNDGPYSPDNCRWATRIEQMRNCRVQKRNKTGVTGVQRIKKDYWRAVIGINNKLKCLYHGRCFQSAVEARRNAELKYWGNNDY